jgi:hypothetical protein
MRRLSGRQLILLPLLVCGCQSLQVVPLDRSGSGSLPPHSWVVMIGGARVPVEGGFFSRDSIVGLQGAGRRFAVSRDSVAFIEERRMSASRTLGAIGLGAVGLAAGAFLLLIAALNGMD